MLAEKGGRVLRVHTYHFHDSFLKYVELMKNKFPKRLQNISLDDDGIKSRFLKTTIGWIKYKPLYHYIIEKENYNSIIKYSRECLEKSISKINTAFENYDFTCLIDLFEEYDKNVKKHYEEYRKSLEVWEKFKYKVKNNN